MAINSATCIDNSTTITEENIQEYKDAFANLVADKYNAIGWSTVDINDGKGPEIAGTEWNKSISEHYAEGHISKGGGQKGSYGGFTSYTWQRVMTHATKPETLAKQFQCAHNNTIDTVAQKAVGEIVSFILTDEMEEVSDANAERREFQRSAEEATNKQLTMALRASNKATAAALLAVDPGGLGGSGLSSREQCFLISHLSFLAEAHETLQNPAYDIVLLGAPRRDYVNPAAKKFPTRENPGESILLDSDSPFGFINKLTQRPADKIFNNMKTSDIASLQPMIRLFKMSPLKNTTSAEEQMQEFIFDAYYGAGGEDDAGHNDLDRYLGDKNSRGQGVGIKDFTFAFEAENPYALKKSISAKLTIFANSFDELLRKRGGGPITDPADPQNQTKELPSYKFLDLALKTGANREGANADSGLTTDTSGKLNFRLTAIVGWQKPPSTISDPNLRSAIDDSYITLNLTPTIHTFNFDDAGRVTFTIEYLAYVDDLFEHPYFNIFGKLSGGGRSTKSVVERKLKYKILNEDCKYDEVDEMINEDYGEFRKDSLEAQQLLMQMMFRRSNIDRGIFKLNVNSVIMDLALMGRPYHHDGEDIIFDPEGQWSSLDFGAGSSSDARLAGSVADAALPQEGNDPWYKRAAAWALGKITGEIGISSSKTVAENLSTNRKDFTRILYFYAGDLIDAILSLIANSFDEYIANCAGLEGRPPDIPGKPGIKIASQDRWNEVVNAEKKNIERFQEEFRRFRLILGPLEVKATQTDTKTINLADIPVSLPYFLGWLDDQMSNKEQVEYSLPAFLSDFFNQFIRDYLNNNTCYGGLYSQKIRLNQNVLVGYSQKPEADDDPVTSWARENAYNMTIQMAAAPSGQAMPTLGFTGRAELTADYFQKNAYPLLRVSGPSDDPRSFGGKNRADQYNYMVFHAARVQPQEQLNGLKSEDEAKGIFHYAIGRDRGLTKTIDLQRNSTPSLAALRYEQQGYNGLMQLRETYDATISSFANVKAFPGTYIYIDPKGFAPSTWGHAEEDTIDEEGNITKKFDLTHLGIGGYYMIKRSTHSFGAGYANSNIDAVWVAETHADGSTATDALEDESAVQSPRKCRIKTKEE